ncbi:MAG: response regulator transcription factor [Acidobacteriota bacterium]
MRILLVEDHAELRAAIGRRLRARGDRVDEMGDGRDLLDYLGEADYDAVVLDRMLPDGDALMRLMEARRRGCQTPMLLLTSRDQIEDRVAGLEAGADDYLVKPFAMEELLARLNAIARRQAPPRPSVLRVADLEVDTGRREVRRGGVLIPLRPKEFALLELLATRAGRAVRRDEILEYCWDVLHDPASNVEEVLVASLRRKLGKPALIHTVRGVGYLLEARSDG